MTNTPANQSIDEVLLKYGREVYLYTNSANQKDILDKSLSKAKQSIKQLITEAINQDRTKIINNICKLQLEKPTTDNDMGWNSALFEAANLIEVEPQKGKL
jgi:hypothetical protein